MKRKKKLLNDRFVSLPHSDKCQNCNRESKYHYYEEKLCSLRDEDNPVVAEFNHEISLHLSGLRADPAKVRAELNKAWGFEDGACNEEVGGTLVGKPGSEDSHFSQAHWLLNASQRKYVRVQIRKDGSMRLVPRPDGSFSL